MNTQNTEQRLIEIAQQIGQIAGCNCHYTAGLAKRIEANGKPLEQLTVAELLALDNEYTEIFNRIHGGDV